MKQSCSVNADGESTLIDSKIYEYDGMVLTSTYSTLEGETEYQTNEMGNLTGVAKNDETYLYSLGMGRLLNQIVSESGNDRVIYDYNEEGLRIKKVLTVDGVSSITDYVWGKNGLAGCTRGTDTVVVLYGIDGTPIGFSLNDTVYTYLKNLQGDVIRVLDTSGNTVVEYSYDPWGVPTITGDTELAAINPCSYRCYDYDEESGYYYLQSRYYNPETGRFLNADALFDDGACVLSNNLFSYCGNNPIMHSDSTGYAIEVALDIASTVWSLIEFIYAPSLKTAGYLIWDIGAAILPFLPGSWIVKGGKFIAKVADTVSDFRRGQEVYTGTYKQLRKVFKGIKNVEIHHLIEKRFRVLFKGINVNDYLSVPLSKDLHKTITQRWRKYFPYGMNYRNISKSQMRSAIKSIYKDMPALQKEVLEWFEKNWRTTNGK